MLCWLVESLSGDDFPRLTRAPLKIIERLHGGEKACSNGDPVHSFTNLSTYIRPLFLRIGRGTEQTCIVPAQRLVFHSLKMNSTTTIVGALPAPSGTTANFTNPEYIGARLVVTAIVCPAIAIPFLLIRLYTKHFLLRRLHLDDCKFSFTFGYLEALTNV